MELETCKKILHKFYESPTWSRSKLTNPLKIAKSTVCSVLKRYEEFLTIERKKRNVKKTGIRNKKLQTRVLRSIKNNPGFFDADRAK